MCVAVVRLEVASAGAGLFYLIGSTLVIAALFALADVVARARGELGDQLRAHAWRPRALLAVLFLLAAVAAAGLPPLPGFLGKAWILAATNGDHWTWAVILIGGLVNLVAVARAGMALFWDMGDGEVPTVAASPPEVARGSLLPATFLMALVVALSLFAGPVSSYTAAAAAQTLDPALYQRAVLGVTP
jgi:multicomponent K+:H+ antiporter subunit D